MKHDVNLQRRILLLYISQCMVVCLSSPMFEEIFFCFAPNFFGGSKKYCCAKMSVTSKPVKLDGWNFSCGLLRYTHTWPQCVNIPSKVAPDLENERRWHQLFLDRVVVKTLNYGFIAWFQLQNLNYLNIKIKFLLLNLGKSC